MNKYNELKRCVWGGTNMHFSRFVRRTVYCTTRIKQESGVYSLIQAADGEDLDLGSNYAYKNERSDLRYHLEMDPIRLD